MASIPVSACRLQPWVLLWGEINPFPPQVSFGCGTLGHSDRKQIRTQIFLKLCSCFTFTVLYLRLKNKGKYMHILRSKVALELANYPSPPCMTLYAHCSLLHRTWKASVQPKAHPGSVLYQGFAGFNFCRFCFVVSLFLLYIKILFVFCSS